MGTPPLLFHDHKSGLGAYTDAGYLVLALMPSASWDENAEQRAREQDYRTDSRYAVDSPQFVGGPLDGMPVPATQRPLPEITSRNGDLEMAHRYARCPTGDFVHVQD